MTEKHLPPAFNGCNCSCHRVPGMIHLVACCAPNMSDLSIDRAWFERRVALEDGVDIGAGHSIVDEASRERSVVIMSRALCQIDGLDPDGIAPRQLVCGPYGEVLPNWEAYREKAEAFLPWFAGGFNFGERVTKSKGSSWTGRVVGFYSTNLTPVGYAVESETEVGSVQIYPAAALSTKKDA